jgi:hypothetical protein
VGFKRGNSEDQFEKHEPHSSGRFDGINAPHQQPKLAALPPSQNHLVIYYRILLGVNEFSIYLSVTTIVTILHTL